MTTTTKPLLSRQFYGMGVKNLEARFLLYKNEKNDAAYLVQGALAVMVRNALCPADFSFFAEDLVRELFMEDYDLSAVRELCVYFKKYFNEEEWTEVTTRLFPDQQEFARLEERTREHIEKVQPLLYYKDRPVEVKASLVTTFEDENGKKHGWTLSNVDPNLTTEDHDALLTILTTLDIFQKDGVRRFAKVVGAYYHLVQVTIDPKAVKEEEPEVQEAKFAALPKVASLSTGVEIETSDPQDERRQEQSSDKVKNTLLEEEEAAPRSQDELPSPKLTGLFQNDLSGLPLVESLKNMLNLAKRESPVVGGGVDPADVVKNKGDSSGKNKPTPPSNQPKKKKRKKRRGKKR